MESAITPILYEDVKNRIGRNLFTLRAKTGDNQADVAYKSGLQPYYISQIENGKRVPTIETLIKLANYFGVALSTIIE